MKTQITRDQTYEQGRVGGYEDGYADGHNAALEEVRLKLKVLDKTISDVGARTAARFQEIADGAAAARHATPLKRLHA